MKKIWMILLLGLVIGVCGCSQSSRYQGFATGGERAPFFVIVDTQTGHYIIGNCGVEVER